MLKSQLTLCLENRPGELARVTKILTEANINIEGISVVDSTDASMVQIIVSNSRNAKAALKKAAVPISEQKIAVITLANKPGALAALATRLAREKINVNYLYATTPPADQPGECSIVISADDLDAVESLWKE